MEKVVTLFFEHFVAKQTQQPVMELDCGREEQAGSMSWEYVYGYVYDYEYVYGYDYELDWLKGVTANRVALKAVWRYLEENSAALKYMQNAQAKLRE